MERASPFDALESAGKPLGLVAFAQELERWRMLPKGHPNEALMAADLLGLRLVGNIKENPWGTYYGPFSQGTRADGQKVTWPSKDDLTPDLVAIWAARAREATHPLLQHRYADLVWDLSKLLGAGKPSLEFALLAIDGAMKALNADAIETEHEAFVIGERALDVATRIKDTTRRDAVESALVAYERRHADDLNPGTWARVFDSLVFGKPPGSEATRKQLAIDMEARLERLSNLPEGERDPFAVEAAATRLARLYRRDGRHADVRRVLLPFRDAFLLGASMANGMLAYAWVDRVHQTLRDHGLADEANALEPLLREYGERSMGEMKPIVATFTISKDEIESAIQALFNAGTPQGLVELAHGFVVTKREVEQHAEQLSKNAPLLAHLTVKKTDDRGRNTASVGSVDSDPDGRFSHEASQVMKAAAPFLRLILEGAKEQKLVTIEALTEHVRDSLAFSEDRTPLVEEGLWAWWNGQHASAAHLLIPQLEAAVRTLAELAEVPTQKRNTQGGLDYRTLDELLQSLIPTIGDDVVFYLRVLLSDRRGWNLRNEVCHGLLPAAAFGPTVSDRLLHALLLLATFARRAAAP